MTTVTLAGAAEADLVALMAELDLEAAEVVARVLAYVVLSRSLTFGFGGLSGGRPG